jgi:hypothetical protein
MVSNAQRNILVDNADYLISKAPIGYQEVRPMESLQYKTWREVLEHFERGAKTMPMDCSESVTSMFRWSGLRDPNGLNYDGAGYTGTLYDHLPHYDSVLDAHPGALIIFGVNPTVHVAMCMERDGDDPWLFSHGSSVGPLHIRLSDEAKAHVGQSQTWLDISNL